MASDSGQKFIRRNRAPRVHIAYEDPYDADRLVELPFVMGVMSDLSGNAPGIEKAKFDDRKFLEFDMDNFDQRMEAIAPRAAFAIENTLTGEGKIGVDLSFKTLDDFSPGAVAKNVPALAKLLEVRQTLNDLMVYMDGKDGAQDLLDKVLKDPELLKAIAAAKPPGEPPAEGS